MSRLTLLDISCDCLVPSQFHVGEHLLLSCLSISHSFWCGDIMFANILLTLLANINYIKYREMIHHLDFFSYYKFDTVFIHTQPEMTGLPTAARFARSVYSLGL